MNSMNAEMEMRIRTACKQGQKIELIKEYRAMTEGCH